ncbi:MAG: hypothetical protein KDE27_10560 [Planctomycetes bacterium]|nr:hypothetical protein [Planctomycetota bacterium]
MPTVLRSCLPGLLAAVAAAAAAQTSIGQRPIGQSAAGQPSAAVARAWNGFQAAAPGQWLVRWHAATGTPLEIYGQGLALPEWRENTLAEARRHADTALVRYRDLLGLGDSDFVERIGARMGRTWSFTFEQSFAGVPVIGGRADVRIHMAGRLCYLGSTAVPVPADFDTTPAIAEATAIAIAWADRGVLPTGARQPGTANAPRLVIWIDHGAAALAPIALAWEVPIAAVDAAGNGPIGRLYVDARNGGVLHWTSDKHECGVPGCRGASDHSGAPRPALPPTTCTVMGYVHTQHSPATTPTNEPLVGLEVVIPGQGTFVTDQNGQFTVNLTNPALVTFDLDGVHTRKIQGSNALVANATLQPGVSQTIQLGAQNSSANELAHTTTFYWVDRINEYMRAVLGDTPQLDLADAVQPTVNIVASCNAYYVGNSINFYHAAGSCNNTAGASVIAHEWGHGLDDRYGGISQVDGLSEGWGDICSMYLLDDPIIGPGFYTNGNGIRNGNNTRQFPTGGGVHTQGQTWMGFAWKLRQNLRTALGTQQAIAVSNDIVIASIVANAIDQPNAVLQAFLADDDDGNIVNGTPHYAELSAACNSHSLPYPPILPGFLAHDAPLAASHVPLQPRFVECRAVPSFGNFTQVRVHYDDGQPRQRVMVAAGAPDTYRALLPGLTSPQLMTYHFEAVHSGGTTYRLPTSGEYGYITLQDERVWFEDFESGAIGWTHGATSGTDDWQIAAPTGVGTTWWSDPPAAYSGSRCAGNNLTGGAYPPSTSSWLRSPPIDCTGYGSLRLRLRRFASCDVGFLDQLSIYVNGQPLWFSPQTPLFDTSWQTYDVSLPSATNNPAVVLEFRLDSDAAIEFGGWAIDDVEIYTTASTLPLTTTLALRPEMAQQGTALQLDIRTPASQPFLWILGDTPGPTQIAGVPDIFAGGALVSFFDYTDATGSYTRPITAPSGVPLLGTVWYGHVLTIDASAAIVASNPFVNLFTQ